MLTSLREKLTGEVDDEANDLYLPFRDSMGPAYREMIATAVRAKPDARNILDICSRLGEPACSLALAFPEANVRCCDASPAMVEKTLQRAAAQRVRLQACTMEMDELLQVESGSQDVVVAACGLMYTVDHAKVLREVQRVLKPGGLFIGTVWQQAYPLADLVVTTMGMVIQRIEQASAPQQRKDPDAEAPKLPVVRLAAPIDPLALADADALDALLMATGYVLGDHRHNTRGELEIDLGQVSSLGAASEQPLATTAHAACHLVQDTRVAIA